MHYWRGRDPERVVHVLVFVYLATVVAANLSVAYFGPWSTLVNAFIFIGLDLTARDALHEQWQGKRLWLKMAALIGIGSLLSYALNRNAGSIALASFLAFAASGMTDAVVYQLLHHRTRFTRVNGSNVVSALVDSLIFPTVAFGALMPSIVVGQFLAKVLGGFLWAEILRRTVWKRIDRAQESQQSN